MLKSILNWLNQGRVTLSFYFRHKCNWFHLSTHGSSSEIRDTFPEKDLVSSYKLVRPVKVFRNTAFLVHFKEKAGTLFFSFFRSQTCFKPESSRLNEPESLDRKRITSVASTKLDFPVHTASGLQIRQSEPFG